MHSIPSIGICLLSLVAIASPTSAQTNGTIQSYTFPECNSDTGKFGWIKTSSQAPDDTCLGSSAMSFRIITPAICANGTRAKIARFEGSRCNHAQVTIPGGLAEIADSDVGKCLPVSIGNYTSDETHASIQSLAFYCDGVDHKDRDGDGDVDVDDTPKGPKFGSVSDSACPRVGSTSASAPFYDHPYPDQCSYIMADRKLKVYFSATCNNGTAAQLAVWSGIRNCAGKPSILTNVTDDITNQCLVFNTTAASSYSFFCNGMDATGKAKSTAAVLIREQAKSLTVASALLVTAAIFSSL